MEKWSSVSQFIDCLYECNCSWNAGDYCKKIWMQRFFIDCVYFCFHACRLYLQYNYNGLYVGNNVCHVLLVCWTLWKAICCRVVTWNCNRLSYYDSSYDSTICFAFLRSRQLEIVVYQNLKILVCRCSCGNNCFPSCLSHIWMALLYILWTGFPADCYNP